MRDRIAGNSKKTEEGATPYMKGSLGFSVQSAPRRPSAPRACGVAVLDDGMQHPGGSNRKQWGRHEEVGFVALARPDCGACICAAEFRHLAGNKRVVHSSG
jgi:hypothetical protein